jgi:hypothetical protein
MTPGWRARPAAHSRRLPSVYTGDEKLAIYFWNLIAPERWGLEFLTNHGQVLPCIAHDPGVRLRDIAARVGITECSAYAIVTDLSAAGYVVKQQDGRRNRHQARAHLPLPEPISQQLAIGEVLAVLAGANATQHLTGPNQPEAPAAPAEAPSPVPAAL